MRLRRLIASYLDFVISAFVALRISILFIPDNFDPLKNSYIFNRYAFMVLGMLSLYVIFKDCLFKNGSIGKKIMKIGIYNNDGSIPSNKKKIMRSLLHIPYTPFEIISIITNNYTIADEAFGTKVVYLGKKEKIKS